MKPIRTWTILLAVAAALPLIAACNDGGGGGGPTGPKGTGSTAVLDVKPGNWDLAMTFTPQGGSCISVLPSMRTLAFCDGIDLAQQAAGFGINCTFSVSGSQITGNCNGSLQVGTAVIQYSGSGSGVIAQSRDYFSVNMTVVATPEGGTPCTYLVNLTGQWKDPGPCGSGS